MTTENTNPNPTKPALPAAGDYPARVIHESVRFKKTLGAEQKNFLEVPLRIGERIYTKNLFLTPNAIKMAYEQLVTMGKPETMGLAEFIGTDADGKVAHAHLLTKDVSARLVHRELDAVVDPATNKVTRPATTIVEVAFINPMGGAMGAPAKADAEFLKGMDALYATMTGGKPPTPNGAANGKGSAGAPVADDTIPF